MYPSLIQTTTFAVLALSTFVLAGAKGGSVSEPICMTSRAALYKYVEIDKCIALQIDRLNIEVPGICANGTQSLLALYPDAKCESQPSGFRDIKRSQLRKCLDMTDQKAFMFYCVGEGNEEPEPLPLEKPVSGKPGNGNGNEGGALHFFLVLGAICLFAILILLLSVYAFVRNITRLVAYFTALFQPKEGTIAL